MTSTAYTPIDKSGAALVWAHSEAFYNAPTPDILILRGFVEYPAVIVGNAVAELDFAGFSTTLPDTQGLILNGNINVIGGPAGVHARLGGADKFYLEHDGSNAQVHNQDLAGLKLFFALDVLLS